MSKFRDRILDSILNDKYTLEELFLIHYEMRSMVKKIEEMDMGLSFFNDGVCSGTIAFDVYGAKGSTYKEFDISLSKAYGQWLLGQEKKKGGNNGCHF